MHRRRPPAVTSNDERRPGAAPEAASARSEALQPRAVAPPAKPPLPAPSPLAPLPATTGGAASLGPGELLAHKTAGAAEVSAEPRHPRDPEPSAGGSSRYIVSPRYDLAFFLLPPALALVVGAAISGTTFSEGEIEVLGDEFSWASLLIGVFIHAHLVAVFFRSHGDAQIRRLYPARFLAVPVVLYAAMLASPWVLVSVSVLATFWDVYHSGMQTFGFARIYDMKAGNDRDAGRRLDQLLNQLLYAGPILGGVTMIDHFEDFEEFEEVGATMFTAVPAFMEGHQAWFTWSLVAVGTAFLGYYLLAYARLQRQGYRVSMQKTWLLASTGACSIYTWGFNSFGEAFFIMNLFHALQYFGIVWWSEKGNMARLFRLQGSRLAQPMTLALFVGLTAAYGFGVQVMDTSLTALWALTLVVSVMHFWYDGFIWSVRRQQV